MLVSSMTRLKRKVSDSGIELSKMLVSSKKRLGNVEVDLITTSEDGVGLSLNESILAIRRFTLNNFSRRISSLIVKFKLMGLKVKKFRDVCNVADK
ncbi:hypothetical protein Tco_0433815 [Tanacetum coccineum]